MEISDQLFEELCAALALADETMETFRQWCEDVKQTLGLDVEKICEKISNTTTITNMALEKVKYLNG